MRRRWIESGLMLMASRELLTQTFSDSGIRYEASAITDAFLSYLEEPYSHQLRERATWVLRQFRSYSDAELVEFFKKNLDRWSGEFIFEGIPEEEQP